MYYLLYGFFYLLSLLPFFVWYRISYFVYLLIYYVIGYRKDVVMANLTLAFPEKSDEEKHAIAKKFYKNFTDNFIETIKLFSITEKQLQKRFICDYSVAEDYAAKGRNVQFHLAHFFNWEYANLSFSLNSAFAVLVVYMPIANKAMNKVFYRLRSRFNAKLIAANTYLKDFRQYSRERYFLVFVADQNAGNTHKAYWLPYFNKLTPFVTGPEKSAQLNNTVVMYAKFKKLKRGHYKVSFHEITTEPKKLPEGELTRRMIQMIEENVKEQPEIYLWTHRRWKHAYDPSVHRAL
jgi:KDO2-lipid IV(A) lauroyltransferase